MFSQFRFYVVPETLGLLSTSSKNERPRKMYTQRIKNLPVIKDDESTIAPTLFYRQKFSIQGANVKVCSL